MATLDTPPTLTAHPAAPRRVLAELIPGSRVRDGVLVIGVAAVVALASQVSVPLGFTPVPLTLGSAAALIAGATLGPVRGSLSIGLFLLAGILGAPVFAGQTGGYLFATFGYAAGYLPATALVGSLARRGHDRAPHKLIAGICVASLIIYTGGVGWLMAFTGAGFGTSVAEGVLPFLPGDAIKVLATALVLPVAWRVISQRRR